MRASTGSRYVVVRGRQPGLQPECMPCTGQAHRGHAGRTLVGHARAFGLGMAPWVLSRRTLETEDWSVGIAYRNGRNYLLCGLQGVRFQIIYSRAHRSIDRTSGPVHLSGSGSVCIRPERESISGKVREHGESVEDQYAAGID